MSRIALKGARGYRVKGPMCFWGMTPVDEQGEGLVKKETWWVTNSECIAQELDRECTTVRWSTQVGERSPAAWHRHVHLVNQLAHQARAYPPKLVAAILRGTRVQFRVRGEILNLIILCRWIRLEPETAEELESYWDDANGGYLNPKLVRLARQKEINEIHNDKVYEMRPSKKCREVTGKKPMAMRCVDTIKRDEENLEYRSRIGAKDLKSEAGPEHASDGYLRAYAGA